MSVMRTVFVRVAVPPERKRPSVNMPDFTQGRLGGDRVYFLEHREPIARPNILGNSSQPVHTYRWKAIYYCAERRPLEDMLSKLDKHKYRITSNQPEENI